MWLSVKLLFFPKFLFVFPRKKMKFLIFTSPKYKLDKKIYPKAFPKLKIEAFY